MRIVLMFFAIFLAYESACACSCMGRTLEKEVEASAAVFVGRAQEVDRHFDREWFHQTRPTSWGPGYGQRVVFEILAQWKGEAERTLTVWTGLGGSDCGILVRPGDTYLVYATHQSDRTLATGLCHRSGPLACRGGEVAALDRMLDARQAARLPAMNDDAELPWAPCMKGLSLREIERVARDMPAGAQEVRALVRVDREGRVRSAAVTVCDPQCPAKTVAELENRMRGWRFEPALVEGGAVPVRVYLNWKSGRSGVSYSPVAAED